MKLLTVVGARPQFIKASAVSHAVAERPDVEEVLVHTGQHYDAALSDVFFRELGIPAPAHHLGIGSGPHGAQTGAMLEAIERVLLQETPDWLLVYGDTNSTLAGALAAAKLHVPVAHVEAGLRSFNRRMPEEVNRILTDHASDLLFTPTDTATAHLRREGVPEDRIRQVGDVMYDVALGAGQRAESESTILEDLGLEPDGFVLATVHRAENTDDPDRLQRIAEVLMTLALKRPVVLPLHPRTRAALVRDGGLETAQHSLKLIPPVGYLDVTRLLQGAALVATDSGGLQKEAFFHGTPCATLRDETEWVELVEAGWNALVPPTRPADELTAALEARLDARPSGTVRPYGDGRAAGRILDALLATAP